MPIPKPRRSESESDFMERCMGDPTMVQEYDSDQRYAVCSTQWEDSRKEQRMEPKDVKDIGEVKEGDTRALSIPTEHMQIKTVSKEDAEEGFGYIEGYSAIWDLIDADREKFRRGAFKKTIKERVPKRKRGESLKDHIARCEVKLMTRHIGHGGGLQETIGTVTDGKEDDIGLWYHAELSSLQNAQDAKTLVEEGHVRKNSVGFGVVGIEWEELEGYDREILTYTECKWYENTLTIIPANENAVITASKSLGNISSILDGLDVGSLSPEDRDRLIYDSFGGRSGLKALGVSLAELREKITALLEGRNESDNRADFDRIAHEIEMRSRELDLLTL